MQSVGGKMWCRAAVQAQAAALAVVEVCSTTQLWVGRPGVVASLVTLASHPAHAEQVRIFV